MVTGAGGAPPGAASSAATATAKSGESKHGRRSPRQARDASMALAKNNKVKAYAFAVTGG
jgi:hypothetical protein